MTPAARIAAAIPILDEILAGTAAEKALVGWARRSRFAGSGDRAAVRDHVFDALRRRRSLAALGGAESGRGLMIGLLRDAGRDPSEVFDGAGHGPAALTAEEAAWRPAEMPRGVRLDCPDWLLPLFEESLGAAAEDALEALRHRAPVFARVNLSKGSREAAIADLAAAGIEAVAHPEVATALEITGNARRLQASGAFREGRIEVQDAASQAAVLALPLGNGMRVLDYCAGGGGKALAIADRIQGEVVAHDIDPGRMADLPARAARAGARIALARTLELGRLAPFDVVFCDAPCSGSGTWRRTPEAKWRLTPERLSALTAMQDEVLEAAAGLVRPGGVLGYATCSVLRQENEVRVERFAAGRPEWRVEVPLRRAPDAGGDGFFLALLGRPEAG